MKIYTRRGDRGETDLFGGGRVAKDHLRVSAYGEELVAKLDADRGDPMLATIPVKAIRALPELHLIADHLSSAVLIRFEVVRDFEALDSSYSTLWGGMRDLMARARRVGFRSVVANRARVAVLDASLPRDSAAGDLQQIHLLNFRY